MPYPWFGGKATVAADVWRRFGVVRDYVEHGDDPLMRIVLCGYDGEHEMPADWTVLEWKAKGGYGSRAASGNENCRRERVWFSRHCLKQSRQTVLSL